MPTPQQWRDGAVALSLLDVCTPRRQSYSTHASLRAVTDAREDLQKRSMQVILAAAKSGKHPEPLSWLRTALRGAVRYGKLTHPEWYPALTDITTDADEHRDLLDALGDAKMHDLGAAMALRAAAAHPSDPGVVVAAFDTLLRAGKGKDAFSLMLDAEQVVPYPDRRAVRLHYLNWLYRTSGRSGGRGQVPEGMMSFQEEREDRRHDTVQPGDAEAHMAMGDIHAVAREEEEAAKAYRTAWQRSTDPAVKWTAWLAGAEVNAREAWHQRDTAEKFMDTAAASPVDKHTFLNSCAAVGLAAGEIETTLQWVGERIDPRSDTPETKRLVSAMAALYWATGRKQEALNLLGAVPDAGAPAQVVRLVMTLPRGPVLEPERLPPGLVYALSRELTSRFKSSEILLCAVRLAVDQMASCESVRSVTGTWEVVTSGLPESPAERTEPLRQELHTACRDWLDRHPDDLAAMVTMVRATAGHAARGRSRRAVRDAGPLFVECLGRAARGGVPAADVRAAVSAFAARLKSSRGTDGSSEAVRQAIVRHYPTLAE